jgi:ribose transport system ATP-binding protein
VRDVSFEVRAGEIFGISGLIGAGRTELLRLIFGADRADSGTIALGRRRRRSACVRRWMPWHGIALITEDRKGEGLLLASRSAPTLPGQHAGISRGGVSTTRRNDWPAADRRHAHPQFGPAQRWPSCPAATSRRW